MEEEELGGAHGDPAVMPPFNGSYNGSYNGSDFDYYDAVGEYEFDVDTFIALNLGPKHLDLGVAVPMTVFYCCLWIFGMAGEGEGEKNSFGTHVRSRSILPHERGGRSR